MNCYGTLLHKITLGIHCHQGRTYFICTEQTTTTATATAAAAATKILTILNLKDFQM